MKTDVPLESACVIAAPPSTVKLTLPSTVPAPELTVTVTVPLAATMIVGRLLGIPIDDLFGVVSGVTGNPAILAYASRAAPTDRPDIGYAMIFPSMTVVKILFVQIVASIFGG